MSGVASVTLSNSGAPVESAEKLCFSSKPFSADTLANMPEPLSMFLILFTEPSISKTAIPVAAPV